MRGVLGEDLALEGEDDGVGVDGGAVVEGDAGAQLEGPHRAVVAHRPAGREVGLGLEAAGREAHEAAVDLLGDLERLDVGGARRVEAHGLGGPRDDEAVGARRRRARARAAAEQRGQRDGDGGRGRRGRSTGGVRRAPGHRTPRAPRRRMRISCCSRPSTRRRSAATPA